MSNLILLKRSLNTAVPSSLANGEFSYTANGDVAYIGSNGAVVAIGGKRNPGVLTANQALVANSTSYLDTIKTATVFIGTNSVNTINAVANSTVLGANANNELTTTWGIKTYVDAKVAGVIATPGGSNTYIEFNDSGSFNGTAGLTFNKTTNALSVGNTITVGTTVLNGSSISVQDASITGNLTVSGTLTTVDAANLKVKDTLIELGDQNTTTDVLSVGMFGNYGNSTVTQYSGIFRDQSDSGKWKLFNTQLKPTTTVDTSNNTYTQATLQAYILAGGLVANSTVINITANANVSSAISANTLALTTALPVSSGGIGISSVTTNGILVGNSAGPMGVITGTDGLVLQSVSGVPTFANLDGGVF